jgi:3'(2'), 5'-bisphosphate nucleotidase
MGSNREPDMSQFASLADGAVARRLADQAGALLRRLRAGDGFEKPAALRAAGDRLSHRLLVGELSRLCPGDAVLSGKGIHHGADRIWADRVWILDPLDGSGEFGEHGRPDWAVHVALWDAGSPAPSRLAAAAVALPARNRVLTTHPAPPRPSAPVRRRPRLLASRSHAPWFVPDLADRLGADLVLMGSAGAKIAAVVSGEADAYVHAGGQYEWDSAAPVAVAYAAGLHASRIDGSALAYNQENPWLPDLLVCRIELADRILSVLAGLV